MALDSGLKNAKNEVLRPQRVSLREFTIESQVEAQEGEGRASVCRSLENREPWSCKFRAETGMRDSKESEWVRPLEITRCPCASSQFQSSSDIMASRQKFSVR